jgi:hypothetical protein
MMAMIRHPMFLRRVLLADAVASGATGALLVLAVGPLARLFGLPAGLLTGAGLVLLGWALAVGWLGLRRAEPPRAAVWAVAGLNAVWAVDSLLLLALPGWVAPTTLGVVFVLAQALVVADLAVLQVLGLRAAAGAGGRAEAAA